MTVWTWAATITVLLASVLLYPTVVRIRRRNEETRPDGLQVISNPENPAFEIVAVHGLGAHPDYTWTYKVSAKSARTVGVQQVHLLKDLLKSDFPDARILSFAHNSDWLIDAPVKTAQQIGQKLLDQLAKHRSNHPRVPIIFIGHSFGGIIIKETLCGLGNRPQDIVDDTCGIIFLGTPHLGSQVSFAAAIAAFLTGFLGSNTTLLLSLRYRQTQLSDLEDRFVKCMKLKESRRQKTEIVSFRETKPTYLLRWLSIGLVVDRVSARGAHAPEIFEIDTDHSGLNKCRQEDTLHRKLREELKRLIPDRTHKPTLNRNQQFVVDKLKPVEGAAFDSHAGERETTCHPGTRRALLKEIDEWVDDPERECIFWLQGKAGTGKSTISRTVAHKFAAANRLGASFFFKRGEADRSEARRFFTTIAAQLVCQLSPMAEHMRNAIEANPAIAEKALREQFEKLILQPLENARGGSHGSSKTVVVVIDALDECNREQDVSDIIRLLLEAKYPTAVRLKVFVTSRPELLIRLCFEKHRGAYKDLALHGIPESVIEEDINAFLEFRLGQIRDQFNKTVPNNWPDKSKVQKLVKMAIPLFIFAATTCRFIEDRRQGGGGPDERLRKILEYETRGDFDPTYLPILDQMIIGLNGIARRGVIEEFKNVVGSIVTLARPLSADSLAHLLGVSTPFITDKLDLLHSVLDIPLSTATPVKLFHLSFRDFLIEHDTEFKVDERATHEKLATGCLQLLMKNDNLKKNICQLQIPGIPREGIDKQDIDKHLPPEVQYACLFWVHHWKESASKVKDGDQAHKFLTCHFLHWLEALSLIGKISESNSLIGTLQSLIATGESTELSHFLHDARCFILQNRGLIDMAPLQLYSSAIIFAPETSVIKRMFNNQKHTWIRRLPKMQSSWSPEVQKLEGHTDPVRAAAFSHDSQLLASASGDRTVRLWNPATGDELCKLKGHTSWVRAVAFSHDSQLLASASRDKTVRLWNPATGDELRKLDIDVIVRRLSFSKDGPYVETDRGLLRIQIPHSSILPSQSKPVCNVFVKECWVARDMENFLWLPPNYRVTSSALQGNILVLGHKSGQITFLEFSFVSG